MTLNEFISTVREQRWPRNAHVDEPGFETLYVRLTDRYIKRTVHKNVLDLANIAVKHPGRGTFFALLKRIRREHPDLNLFVENVLTRRFEKTLGQWGFTRIEGNYGGQSPSFFLATDDALVEPK